VSYLRAADQDFIFQGLKSKLRARKSQGKKYIDPILYERLASPHNLE